MTAGTRGPAWKGVLSIEKPSESADTAFSMGHAGLALLHHLANKCRNRVSRYQMVYDVRGKSAKHLKLRHFFLAAILSTKAFLNYFRP